MERRSKACPVKTHEYYGVYINAVRSETAKLIRFCSSNNLQSRLGKNANVHYVLWESTNINERSKPVLEFLGYPKP